MNSSTVSHGILRTKEEQDEYETKWHTRIYTPGWNELHCKVKKRKERENGKERNEGREGREGVGEGVMTE